MRMRKFGLVVDQGGLLLDGQDRGARKVCLVGLICLPGLLCLSCALHRVRQIVFVRQLGISAFFVEPQRFAVQPRDVDWCVRCSKRSEQDLPQTTSALLM